MAKAAAPQQVVLEPGQWLWDDPDHGGYTKFDDDTSGQIEAGLKKAVDDRTKGPIEVQLSAGPWFGLAKNKGVYSCVLIVDCTDPSNPIINQARQTNTNTGFKRPIKRDPPLDPPLAANLQQILDKIEGKWEWKDDSGWKEYDLETMQQIEESYQRREEKVELAAGDWFGLKKNLGIYYIDFNYLSVPASAQQHNKKSHYGRWVRRIETKKVETKKELSKQEKFLLKNDKHFLWRKCYWPLAQEDYAEQTKQEKLKCSVCLEEFKEENLLETQKKDKIKNKKECGNKNNDDEKQNSNSSGHTYDLTAHRRLVKDTTMIGLNECKMGHYFHGKCILNALNATKICPICTRAYAVVTGSQPEGRLYITRARSKCSGYDSAGASIKLLFEFPGGIQTAEHPNPGKIYFGDLREAFLPNNEEGREAAMLTRIAFARNLIFTVGTSLTLNQDNRIIFASLHLKTSTSGGQEKHGWPDEGYFERFKKELKVKGITTDDLDDADREFIKNGFKNKDFT